MKMPTWLLVALSILVSASPLYASSYYVDPFSGNDNNDGSYSHPWKTLKAIQDHQSQFVNGDEIRLHRDGKWFPGMELANTDGTKGCNFVVPNGVIKIASYTASGYSGPGNIPEIWGTVSINGNWTFAWDGYKNSGYIDHPTLGPWRQYGDTEIYYKILRACPNQVWDDYQMMTPVVTLAGATSVSLERGEFTYIESQYVHVNLVAYDDCLFYRSFDGQPPSEHQVHASAMNLTGKNGLIEAHDVSNRCYLIDLKAIGAHWSGGYPAGIAVTGDCTLVQLIRCNLWRNSLGVQFLDRPWYNCMVKDSTIVDNYSRGIGIQGDIFRLEINNCYLDSNGRRRNYWPSGFSSSADDDGIGIGQQGCNATSILITNCSIYNSGEIEDSDDAGGSGIYLGTTEPCDVNYIEISNCTIENSHAWGIQISLDGCKGGLIDNNVIRHNINANKNRYHEASKWYAPVRTGKCNFTNNIVEDNYSQFAGANINHPVNATGNVIKNNKSAYNDASFPWWGEVVLENWNTSGTLDYNTLSGTAGSVLLKHSGLGSYYATQRLDYVNSSGNSANDTWQ